MEINLIFKIAAVGIIISILNQILTGLAGLLLVLYWILPYILELFTTMQKLFDM